MADWAGTEADWFLVDQDVRQLRMLQLLANWAVYWAEREVCGFLYNNGPINVDNVADEPRRQYAMNPHQQYAVMSNRGWPEAVYHTHPGGTTEASTLDLASALPNVPMLIGWPGGGGCWLNGTQTQEVHTMSGTNDMVDVYQDKGGEWRWRRIAPNNSVISGSEESFSSKAKAAQGARRANPDAFDTSDVGSLGGGNVDAAGDGGATTAGLDSSGYTGPTTPNVG